MNPKDITRKSYEETAEEYASNVEDLAPFPSMEKFIQMLPPKATLLDIGSGSGRDAKIFSERGLQVTGVDICENLLKIAKAHAPLAQFYLMDMESMTFPEDTFDGVWSSSALPHLSKEKLPHVINSIHSILKKGGAFYFNLKQGSGEGLENDDRYEPNRPKFWAYYEADEIRTILQEAHFIILELSHSPKRLSYQSHDVFRVFCRKP